MVLFEYKALAKATLAFCPPDKFTPFSPIYVSTPFPNILISSSNEAYLIDYSSFCVSSSNPNKMLDFIVPDRISGFCGTKAKLP